MANILIFDEATGKVKQYLQSQNTPDFTGRTDVVIQPNISALLTVPMKYWKVSGGIVTEMTQGEKDAVDALAVQAATTIESVRLAALDTKISSAKVSDATLTKIDNAIDAISNLSDAKVFLKKLARYLVAK